MTAGGGVLHKAALGLSPVGEEIHVACQAWQVCSLYQVVINGIRVHHLVNSKQTWHLLLQAYTTLPSARGRQSHVRKPQQHEASLMVTRTMQQENNAVLEG